MPLILLIQLFILVNPIVPIILVIQVTLVIPVILLSLV